MADPKPVAVAVWAVAPVMFPAYLASYVAHKHPRPFDRLGRLLGAN